MITIKCNDYDINEVRGWIEEESKKSIYNPVLSDVNVDNDCIIMTGKIYEHYPLCDDNRISYMDDLQKSPTDLFKDLKSKYNNLNIEGTLRYENDEYFINFYFSSPAGEESIKEEYAYQDDEALYPISNCWFTYKANTDYGIELITFVTKSNFETFIEDLKRYAKDNNSTLDEIVCTRSMFRGFLSKYNYNWPSDDKESLDCYNLLIDKYKETI